MNDKTIPAGKFKLNVQTIKIRDLRFDARNNLCQWLNWRKNAPETVLRIRKIHVFELKMGYISNRGTEKLKRWFNQGDIVTRAGDREIGVVSGRVGLYAYSAPLKKTVGCTAFTSFEGCASSRPCSICYTSSLSGVEKVSRVHSTGKSLDRLSTTIWAGVGQVNWAHDLYRSLTSE